MATIAAGGAAIATASVAAATCRIDKSGFNKTHLL